MSKEIPEHVIEESFFVLDGQVFWKERPESHFLKPDRARAFNSRWAGQQAFTSDNGKGYRTTTLTHLGVCYRIQMHRVLFCLYHGYNPIGLVDHQDGDILNNCPENLRDVTPRQNAQNCKRSSANTSGVTGVYWFKPRRCWTAQIRIGGKSVTLGYFREFDDAVRARRNAQEKAGYHKNHGRVC